MNATLFTNIPVSTLGLFPNPAERIAGSWATAVVTQILRSAGFAGSVNAVAELLSQVRIDDRAEASPNVPTYQSVGTYGIWKAQASATLPWNAYGTVRPPAIWAVVQFGSVVYYRNSVIVDPSNLGGVIFGENPYGQGPIFHTWIGNLRVTYSYQDGATLAAWAFDMYHENDNRDRWGHFGGILPITFYRSPSWEELTQSGAVPPTITFHWYALGVDPNLQ